MSLISSKSRPTSKKPVICKCETCLQCTRRARFIRRKRIAAQMNKPDPPGPKLRLRPEDVFRRHPERF
jgi:hypothetical protein